MTTKLAIPQTVAEMQEILNDKRKAAEYIAAGQFTEVMDAYSEITRPKFADQVADQLNAFFDGKNIIEDRVESALDKVLKTHGVNRPTLGAPDPGTGAHANAHYNPMAPGVAMDEIGFMNIGDFARTVFGKNPSSAARDQMSRAQQVMNAYSSLDPATGGFLIPETMRSEVAELALEQEIVEPRATVITMNSLTMLVPYVDQTTHSGSLFGGMVFYWTPESGALTPTEAKFGRMKLEAQKLTGLARVPNELWADAPALSSWLMRAMPRGIAFFKDQAFLTGNGVGQPLGILNSNAAITITKETGQAASSLVTENILGMYARLLPQSQDNAVWVANPSTFPQLMSMSISVGVGGAPVMLMDLHSKPNMTLLGRPVIFTEKVPALGALGDIGLYDFSFYFVGDRQAVSLESSSESRFANDETELRVILRCDGRPWIQQPLTPANGATLSPFVLLGART